VNADKRDNRRAPPFDLRFKPSPARAKFVVRELISTGRGTFNDIGNAISKIKKKRPLKGRKKAWSKSAAKKSRPKSIARPAKMPPDGRGVEAGIDAREEHDQILGREIGNELVARGKDLGLGGFPGSD
jgi:hypothetical protein